MPYLISHPEKVLILGAGSGNEAVIAVDSGAKEVHAVEIDPVIAGYGKTLHPNKPYLSDKVKIRTRINAIRFTKIGKFELYLTICPSPYSSAKNCPEYSCKR